VPRGDRHSVLVLPGLFAGDGYLEPLRRWLLRVDYTPVRSGLKRNPGWSEEVVHELGGLAEESFRRSGQRITIIGHSMGGVIGRSLAVRHPVAVRHVITLGSPLMMSRGVMPESVRITCFRAPQECARGIFSRILQSCGSARQGE
jgi:pimeloyl-ACP methyl ester carboxylesterase